MASGAAGAPQRSIRHAEQRNSLRRHGPGSSSSDPVVYRKSENDHSLRWWFLGRHVRMSPATPEVFDVMPPNRARAASSVRRRIYLASLDSLRLPHIGCRTILSSDAIFASPGTEVVQDGTSNNGGRLRARVTLETSRHFCISAELDRSRAPSDERPHARTELGPQEWEHIHITHVLLSRVAS
ncbi:hypothetical protein EJB05_33296, partial [Eragrostis curvula]